MLPSGVRKVRTVRLRTPEALADFLEVLVDEPLVPPECIDWRDQEEGEDEEPPFWELFNFEEGEDELTDPEFPQDSIFSLVYKTASVQLVINYMPGGTINWVKVADYHLHTSRQTAGHFEKLDDPGLVKLLHEVSLSREDY